MSRKVNKDEAGREVEPHFIKVSIEHRVREMDLEAQRAARAPRVLHVRRALHASQRRVGIGWQRQGTMSNSRHGLHFADKFMT